LTRVKARYARKEEASAKPSRCERTRISAKPETSDIERHVEEMWINERLIVRTNYQPLLESTTAGAERRRFVE
jgi:hypothetical protein